MKKLFPIIVFLFASFLATAQKEYKSWKVDVGILMGELTNQNTGIIAPYIEPKYNINDRLSVGLRAEHFYFTINGNPDPENPYLPTDGDGSISSLVPTAEYNFTNYKLRPFLGAGAGYYQVNFTSENIYQYGSPKQDNFGVMFKAGINVDHIKFSGEYNYLFLNQIKLNYFALKLGYHIGGGKKLFW